MRKTWEKRNFSVHDIVVKELSLMRKLLEFFFFYHFLEARAGNREIVAGSIIFFTLSF